MKYLVIFLLILFSGLFFKSKKLSQENAELRQKVVFLEQKVLSDSCTLAELKELLRKHENHVYRMQLIAGVKNPDSIFTFKEKVKNPVNFKSLLSNKNREKQKN